MRLLNWLGWLKRPKVKTSEERLTSTIPDDLWIKCESCLSLIYNHDFRENLKVCPECNHHHRLTAREQLFILADAGSFQEEDINLGSRDLLGFTDKQRYSDKLKETQKKTGLKEAIVTGFLEMKGKQVAIAVMDFVFLGGSMGTVVGEKLERIIYKASKKTVPLIIICASGGARMQEGIFSLMQMAKVNSALNDFSSQGLFCISVLTNPTTGGVTASFAYGADIVLAEKGALIGFAGPRVIEQTTREILPQGFQRADFLLEKGMVDMVVDRSKLKETLGKLVKFYYGR